MLPPTERETALYGRCRGGLRAVVFAAVLIVSAGRTDPDHLDPLAGLAVEIELVDLGAEALVVGAQRLQHLPDVAVDIVAIERRGRVHVRGDDDRQDHVAVAFVLSTAHHSPHRLHHVDLRPARLQEQHGIQGGHVDTLGQTAGVAEHVAAVTHDPGLGAQPVELAGATQHAALAVHVPRLDRDRPFRDADFVLHRPDQLGEVF